MFAVLRPIKLFFNRVDTSQEMLDAIVQGLIVLMPTVPGIFFLKISSGIKKHEFHLFGKGHLHTSIEKINNKCIFKLLLVPGGCFCFRHRCIFKKNFVFKMSLDKPLLKEIIITTFNLLLMYLTCQVR